MASPLAVRQVDLGGLAAVCAFCVLYGSIIGIDPRAGGAASLGDVALGIATAVVLFVPTFLLTAWMARRSFARPRRRIVALVASVIGGLALGCLAADAFPMLAPFREAPHLRHVVSFLPLATMGLAGLAILLLRERSEATLRALHAEATRRTMLEREAAQAELLLLQAQVEPHFLFNSLAHVRRLYRNDASAGSAMLRNLMRYLSAMAPITTERGIALASELELAVAYLGVQQARMGDRLSYEVEVSDDALRVQVPPMIVTTLVENSIKHGLSVLPEGGAIRIEAHVDGDATCIRVCDTGAGFRSTIGAGVGLANARARLHALHGDVARLELARNEPHGVAARIVIPCA
jgi:two-component sensor histidine kinase